MAKKTKTKTKITDIRKLSDAALKKELDESYRRLFSLCTCRGRHCSLPTTGRSRR